ncbi:MAG TPA: hypothetical protein VJ742_11780, partial [Nitrososphaera sp.]|nr:hypothetical protein [Nitrososphaera sp.]
MLTFLLARWHDALFSLADQREGFLQTRGLQINRQKASYELQRMKRSWSKVESSSSVVFSIWEALVAVFTEHNYS